MRIGTEEEFLEGMEVTGEDKPVVVQYDTSTYKDRAIIQFNRDGKLIGLRKTAITGRAIISETNYSVFVKDEDEIAAYGQIVKNVTSKFLSDDLFENEPFYKRSAKDFVIGMH